jgi:hypothetical protein
MGILTSKGLKLFYHIIPSKEQFAMGNPDLQLAAFINQKRNGTE